MGSNAHDWLCNMGTGIVSAEAEEALMKMRQAEAMYSRAYDCKHSERICDAIIKHHVLPSVSVEVAEYKLTKLSEDCPYYKKVPFGDFVPAVFCQHHCEKYEKRGTKMPE